MAQDERGMARYVEMVKFIETHKRIPLNTLIRNVVSETGPSSKRSS